MRIIQNYTLKKNVVKNGVASRDQESVQIADSPTRRYGESATPRLADAGSRRLPASASRRRRRRSMAAATVDGGGDGRRRRRRRTPKIFLGLTVVINERIL